MAKTEFVRARIDPAVKHEAEGVLKALGLSTSQAITLFYRQITMTRGLPFAVSIPNAETIQAFKESREEQAAGNLETFASPDALFDAWDDEDGLEGESDK